MKRPEKANKVDDPNYCKYHRLVSHPVEKCFILKDKIMALYEEGKIEFEEEIASMNMTSITMVPYFSNRTIKFGSFDPIRLPSNTSKMVDLQANGGNHLLQEANTDDDGWTLVTCQRNRKQNLPKPVKVPISAKMIGWQCKALKPKMPLIKTSSPKHKNLTWKRS